MLPVWLLLCPRDYLSSFLKIGTIVLLVVGVLIGQSRRCRARPSTRSFMRRRADVPTAASFPFVFICIMCGAISGFHALVSSRHDAEDDRQGSHVRMIGYGAMLMEGLVGVVALIAAASLARSSITTSTSTGDKVVAKWQPQLDETLSASSATAA